MALCWSIQGPTNSSFFVVWVLVITVFGVESSTSDYPSGTETKSSLLIGNNVRRNIYQRSTDEQTFHTDEQTFQPFTSKVNEDIDNLNQNKKTVLSEQNEDEESMVGSKEKNISYEVNEDEVKLKHNKQPKVNFNLKNYSDRKIASNESSNEKQKPNLFVGHSGFKFNNLKKELKLSSTINDQILKSNLSNLAVPGSYKLENRKTSLTELETTPSTKLVIPDEIAMKEAHVMSDQPEPIDILQNTTDLSNDDSLDIFSDNTTSKTFDNSNITTSSGSRTMPTTEVWDILVVSGIILGTLVFIGVVASGGYVVYRRRIWNKPQTLSDKCSNADSSGYIDDSTMRENSEEMYSLDNDSFLNSLEAMTIQNYWTDNVKHTKL